ncbi:MAG: proton-conducting transporter membrane subunit [Planctomycetota bacterium]
MTPANAILYALFVCGIGAVATLLVSRNKTLAGWVAFLATAAAGGLALHAAAVTLLYGAQPALTIWTLPQYGSALRISIDGLSAIFIGLIAVISILASCYSIQYMTHYKNYGVARYYPYFMLFIAGMYGIVSTTDMMLFFFIFWQVMTLASYALVRYENKKPENVRAAYKYLIMMEIACALIMVASGMLAGGEVIVGAETLQKYDFDAIRHGLPEVLYRGGGTVIWAFIFFFIGFGIKAGMWPFGQMWLPDAHPAAPSPVSALLSGVMIKTGVYGLIRSFLWLIPTDALSFFPCLTWGTIIAVVGAITLFIGTLQALKQEQTKRLLAFHSIGQIGYILLGLGTCLLLLSQGLYLTSDKSVLVIELATLGFYGALFHTLNHAMFKSLLFMNAGSMLYATGTQNLNKLGGLMKYMPLTAVTTIIASFSIAGVPLFNGFASKWTIYVSTILGSSAAASTGILAFCAVLAILTSALTLASFMKFFGASFLSRTSTLVAQQVVARKSDTSDSLEVGWSMRLPQVVLAIGCLFFGLVPLVAYNLIHQALGAGAEQVGTLSGKLSQLTSETIVGLVGAEYVSGKIVLAPLVLFGVLAVMFALAWLIAKLGGAERRTAKPWLCGYAEEADHNRYTAHHLYGEFKRMIKWPHGKY